MDGVLTSSAVERSGTFRSDPPQLGAGHRRTARHLPDSDAVDVAEAAEEPPAARSRAGAPPPPRCGVACSARWRTAPASPPGAGPRRVGRLGKPLSVATARWRHPPAAADFGSSPTRHPSSSECQHRSARRHAFDYMLRHPPRVVGTISPWNLPLYLLTWKEVAPALAVGNTVVAKPSEVTPVTAHWPGHRARGWIAARRAQHRPGPRTEGGRRDVPPSGDEGHLVHREHRTGAEIARTAGPLFKKLSLEMGGKNPVVIFCDAELDAAVATAVRSVRQPGADLPLRPRIFVERSVYPGCGMRWWSAGALKLGGPLLPETEQGALVSRAHLDKVLRYFALAREEAAGP